MAIFEYKFPELGEGIHEGEIVKLHIKPGDTVTDEDLIMDVQNDKAVVEVPCPVNGIIKEIKVKEGQVCTVGQLVATIEVEGEVSTQADPTKQPEAIAAATNKQSESAAPLTPEAPNAAKAEVLATPSVRKLAREKGVTLSTVPPSGRNGHVTREDVLSFAEGGKTATAVITKESSPEILSTEPSKAEQLPEAAAVAKSADVAGERIEERIPFKGIRKIIANAMVKSVYTAPHVTLMDEVDVTRLVALRQKAKPIAEQKGVKLTYLPFIIKALVAAVRQYPIMNATLDEENNEIVYKKYYHIGIATDTDNGLIVPVIPDADRKNMWTIAGAITDLAARGREGKLAGHELKGSTISISNIGSAGGMFFTPVINFPEVAILGTGRITDKPVVKDGQIVIAPMMALSLSFDHRIVDGATAQNFLNVIKMMLADPELLVMEG